MEAKHFNTYPALSAAFEGIDLQGKSVLITGGGYGIGIEIATAFASRKVSQIILVGRTETKLKDAAASLSSSYSTDVIYRTADIASKSDVKRLFDSLDISPDFLINNAGILPRPEPFVDADLDVWWAGFTTNVFGTALVTQSYLQHRRGLGGADKLGPAVVVTLNTQGAFAMHTPNLSAYGASKAASARWSEIVSTEVPRSDARLVSVHPGSLLTDMAANSGMVDQLAWTEGKLVGEFITWLTSEEAEFLAGRFVWVNWDIEDLLRKKDEIIAKNLFISSLAQ